MYILILENNLTIKSLLKKYLEKKGHKVIFVSSAQEALSVLRTNDKIQVVITNWLLSGMGGPKFCTEIREKFVERYIYIIILTSMDKKDDHISGFKAGADDYIVKPFNNEELVAKIHVAERIINLESKLMKNNDNMRKKLTELTIINHIASELASSKKLNLILRNVLQSTLDLLPLEIDCGSILLINEEGDKLVLKGTIGLTESLKEDMEIEFNSDIAGRAIATKESIVVEDTEKYNMPLSNVLRNEGIKNFVSIPIVAKGKIHGAINVGSHVQHCYNTEEIDLLTLTANQLGLAIDNVKLFEETRKALEDLRKTQSQLLQSEKMASIGQLAAGVAHEINNPTGFVHSNLGSLKKYVNRILDLIHSYEEGLNSLKGDSSKDIAAFCEGMEQLKKKLKIDFILDDLKNLIDESLNGTERIKKIVADLKNFSRVDQEEMKPADINEGLESTLNVVWNELKYKCTVEKKFGDLPQTCCNMGQLNQVFMNLLVNAAQSIEKRGTITISTSFENGSGGTQASKTNHGHIRIMIHDTGSGIPGEKLDRIFEPFYTTKEVGKGTGLGLSIAYDIISKHHGEIKVESKVGQGTTFNIILPLMTKDN